MIRVNWFPALCQIKLRPANYVGEIIKNNFISTVRPTVHTNPSRTWSLSKTLFKPRNLKTPTLRFNVDRRHFENEACRKRWGHYNHVISQTEFSLNTNPKMTSDCCIFIFSGAVWARSYDPLYYRNTGRRCSRVIVLLAQLSIKKTYYAWLMLLQAFCQAYQNICNFW